jgi:hypothetical protein
MSLTDEQNSNKPTRDSALAAALGSLGKAGVTYVMPDAALKGFAYAANAPYEGEKPQSVLTDPSEVQEIMAALAEIDAQPTDVKLALGETRASLVAALGGGKKTIDPRNVRDIIEKVKDTVEDARARAAEAAAERQAEMQRLTSIIDNAYKDLRAAGYGDNAHDKKLAAMTQELENLEPGSAAWKAKKHEIAELEKEYFKRVEQEAIKNGNQKAAEDARKAAEAVAKREEGETQKHMGNYNRDKANQETGASAPLQIYSAVGGQAKPDTKHVLSNAELPDMKGVSIASAEVTNAALPQTKPTARDLL